MIKLILLGTSGCHLCEQAEIMLEMLVLTMPTFELNMIDIAEQPHWQQPYAIKIPVLYHAKTQSELMWPFSEQETLTFMNGLNHDQKR